MEVFRWDKWLIKEFVDKNEAFKWPKFVIEMVESIGDKIGYRHLLIYFNVFEILLTIG